MSALNELCQFAGAMSLVPLHVEVSESASAAKAYDEYRGTEIVSQLPNRKRGYRKEKRNGKGQEISRAYYSDG